MNEFWKELVERARKYENPRRRSQFYKEFERFIT